MHIFANHPVVVEMHTRERVKDLRRQAEMWRLAEEARAARRQERSAPGLVARATRLLAAIRGRVRPQAQAPVAC